MIDKDLQQTETIEFLKTRLMERDREISDFQTKTKKIQLKHNRDLKEAKIAEERSKNLLKQEKAKADRYSKQLKEYQEQVAQLNTRVVELLKEKEREVNEIKCLYNSMKEQVRKYERILPTLTFLNQFGLTIQTIPPYQDIFINLKDKIVQLQQTIHSFQQYKIKNQEIILNAKQNEENMRTKKLEIQKSLNEILSKIQEYELQNSQLRIIQNELRQKNEELQRLYQNESLRNQQHQRSHKQYQQRIQELQIYYSNQLQNKEEEIRKIAQDEFARFEHQIQSLQAKFQMKQKMYLQQIRILQDEVYFLQGKISEQKTNFQQHYIEIKEQIEKMREEVEREREAHQQLKLRYEQIVRSLIKVGRHNDQLQLKVQSQERKIQMYEEKQSNSMNNVSDIQISQIRHMQQIYDELLQKYSEANNIINTLKQANFYLQEETATLRSEIISKTTPEYSHSLELPLSFLHFQNLIKNTSSQDSTTNNSQLHLQNNYIENTYQNSFNTKVQNKQLNEKINTLQSDITLSKEKTQKIQDQLLKQMSVNQKMSKELVAMKKQRDRYFQQIVKLKQKNVELSRELSQKQKQIALINGHSHILKEKVQFLTKNQQSLNQKLKKELALQDNLKEEIKQFKELGSEENIFIKRIKQLTNHLQLAKRQNDKIRSDNLLKENATASEIRQLKKQIDQQTKNNEKTYKLNNELTKLKEQNVNLQAKIDLTEIEKHKLFKDIQAFKQEISKKQREVSILAQSLARERKERSLLSVPSLKVIDHQIYEKEGQKILTLSQNLRYKDEKLHDLERQILDLKEQIDTIKVAEKVRLESIQTQQNYYIQQIIGMKMKCAESEMKAAECQHLYNLLKRKSSKTTL